MATTIKVEIISSFIAKHSALAKQENLCKNTF